MKQHASSGSISTQQSLISSEQHQQGRRMASQNMVSLHVLALRHEKHLQHVLCRNTLCSAGAKSLMLMSCIVSSNTSVIHSEAVLYGCTGLSLSHAVTRQSWSFWDHTLSQWLLHTVPTVQLIMTTFSTCPTCILEGSSSEHYTEHSKVHPLCTSTQCSAQ